MIPISRVLLTLILSAHCLDAVAAEAPIDVARKALLSLGVGDDVRIDAASESVIPGFYEVVAGGKVAFVSKDGRFVFNGNAYDIPERRDIGESSRARMRVAAINALGAGKFIRFAPDKIKHAITVFTDVDCPFCRRFHEQMASYNARGIAVDYLFYPLDIHPGADLKAEAVWCADDRASALTAAMAGHDAPVRRCPNPIAETIRVAESTGIIGTPTILAADGTQLTAELAMDPDKLLAELDRRAALVVSRQPSR